MSATTLHGKVIQQNLVSEVLRSTTIQVNPRYAADFDPEDTFGDNRNSGTLSVVCDAPSELFNAKPGDKVTVSVTVLPPPVPSPE